MPYTNFSGNQSNVIANNSYFRDANFITTQLEHQKNIFDHITEPKHLVLLGIDGIRISNCTFKNEDNFDQQTYEDHKFRGIGIYAVNSSFHVSGACMNGMTPDDLPCQTPTVFSRLFYGIHATSVNPLKSIFVKGCNFNTNYHGALINSASYPTFSHNYFEVLNKEPDFSAPNDLPYGLHFNDCSDYYVEENMFKGSQGRGNFLTYPKVGLQISLTSPYPEKIRNNVFEDFGYGYCVFVQGSGSNPDPIVSNLQIRCNDFRLACKQDFSASGIELPTTNVYVTQNGKLGANQGVFSTNQEDLAGNTFQNTVGFTSQCTVQQNASCSVSGVPYPEAELNNTNGTHYPINYYHHQVDPDYAVQSICYSSDFIMQPVTGVTYDSKNISCPYQAEITPIVHPIRGSINTLFTQLQGQIQEIDGGSTFNLLALIQQNNWNGSLKNTCINYSPYLSDEVLLAIINKAGVPPGHLKQMLEVNSPLTPKVWSAVENRNPTLPPGIFNQLKSLQKGISERTKLESVIAGIELEIESQKALYVRSMLAQDTIPGYLDSIKSFMSDFPQLFQSWEIASVYSVKKEYTQALALLDQYLAMNPGNSLVKLQRLMIQFEQLPQWCYDATEPQKDELYELAYLELKTCPAAEGLLREILGYPVLDERIIGNAVSTRSMTFGTSEKTLSTDELLLYPNPSTESVVINCLRYPNGTIHIMDISGKEMYSTQLNSGSTTVSTASWSNGIYFVHLTTDTRSIVKKLVVNH